MFLSLLSQTAFLAVSIQQNNSAGLLAQTIQSLNSDFNSLGAQRASALTTRNELLSSEAQLSSSAYSTLLSSQIEDTEAGLARVRSDIEREQAALRGTDCQGIGLCTSCLVRLDCVWCAAEERCVAGDSDGPWLGECTDYTRKCDCQHAQSCSECEGMNQNCGWCTAYSLCQSQSAQCDSWLEGDCPAAAPVSAQLSAELEAERVLTQSLQLQADLQRQLRLLRDQLTSILQRSPASPPSVQYQPPSTLPTFANTVASTAQSQSKCHSGTRREQNYASAGDEAARAILSAGLEQVDNTTRTSTTRENRFFRNLRNDYDEQLRNAEQDEQELQDTNARNNATQAQNQQLAQTSSFLERW